MEIDIGSEQVATGVAVHVRVRLSPRELNRLYLAGDTLILLPAEGLAAQESGAPIPRTSMFLSEIAGNQTGFTRVFTDAAPAEAFATKVREQIATALEGT